MENKKTEGKKSIFFIHIFLQDIVYEKSYPRSSLELLLSTLLLQKDTILTLEGEFKMIVTAI